MAPTELKDVPESVLLLEAECRQIESQGEALRGKINARIATLQAEIDLLQDLLGRVPTDPTSEEDPEAPAQPRESRA